MNGKKKNHGLRAGISLLVALCMLVVSFSAVAYADVLSDLEDEKSQIQQQQQELEEKSLQLKEKLEELKNDEAKQQEYQSSLEEQIGVVMDQIDASNEQLDELDADIANQEKELEQSEAELEEAFELLKQRLCALYKLGNAGTLEIILNAKNLPELAHKAELMSAISRHDTQLMERVHAKIDETEAYKKQLEEDRQEAAALRTSQEEKREELTALQEENERVLQELGENKAEVSEQIRDADQQKEELINQLAEIQRQWLAEKNKPTPTPEPTPEPSYEPNTGGSSGTVITPAPTSKPSSPTFSTGYTWPVPGFTKVGDGWYEGGRAHKGIDIIGAGIYGQPIVAAQSGEVLTAYTADEWGYGWGYHVMIGHDDGYATQYAHMSRVAVTTGQYVEKGQVIGYVGNTGDSYGAHLHFELWENGERINPEIVLPYR